MKKDNSLFTKTKEKFLNLSLSEKILLSYFFIGFIGVCYFIFTGAHSIFHSDAATANLLAREQIISGQLFPKDWYYVQDIWTFFINVPMVFISSFIKNQLVLRSSAVFLQSVFFTILLIAFSRKILKNNSWILYCAVLFTGISDFYTAIMFGEAAYEYVTFWILLLTTFGLLSIDENLNMKKKQLFIFSILILISSIGGVRYISSFLAPFLLAICLVYYIDNQNLLTKDILSHLLNFMKWLVVVAIAAITGLIIFMYLKKVCGFNANIINTTIYSGYEYENIISGVKIILPSLWVLMGFDTAVPLLSISGMFSIIKMVATIAFMFVFPIMLTSKYKTLSISVKRFVCFSWFSFIITCILYILIPNMAEIKAARYFQVTVVLQIIISCYYIYKYMLNRNFLTTFVSMAVILIYISGSLFGLVKSSQNEKEILQPSYDLIEVLKQKGLKFGYAKYWDAYRLSVLADFNPEIVAIVGDPISPMYHLSSSRWYTDKYYNGKTFLMLDEESYKQVVLEGKAEKQFGKEEEIFKNGGYYFLVYNYNISSKFANRVFIVGEKRSLIDYMCYNEFVDVNYDNSLNAKKNGIIYGPYISIPKGNYLLEADYQFLENGNSLILNITADAGKKIIKQLELKNGQNEINLTIDKDLKNLEFAVYNDCFDSVMLKEIYIEKLN